MTIPRFSQPNGPYDANFIAEMGYIGFRTDVERENTPIQTHDVESPDLTLVMNLASEVIAITGARVDVHHRTDNRLNADGVFDEDPDPTYWPAEPMKGFFAPGAIEAALKVWGYDTPIKIEIYFAMVDLTRKFGTRVLRAGDVIYIPFNAIGNIKPRYFRVNNFTPIGNYRYAWVYAQCKCESLNADIAVMPKGTLDQQQEHMPIGDYQDE